jgi:SanA protein
MKTLLKIFLLLFILSIWSIIISDFLTISQTQNNIYSSLEELPENKVGLVLWTSKYIADGRRNLFYLYRIQAIQELYEAGKIEYILVSGDNSTEKYNETDTIKNDLIDLWIPEEKIYGDYAGFRTLDSIVRTKEIFWQSEYTIVTQKFHLERAIFLAKSEWIDAVWYQAKDVPIKLAPRVWIRERLARVKMMLDIITWVEPKFWGESIEIGGKNNY